jgi:hypothetical protein
MGWFLIVIESYIILHLFAKDGNAKRRSFLSGRVVPESTRCEFAGPEGVLCVESSLFFVLFPVFFPLYASLFSPPHNGASQGVAPLASATACVRPGIPPECALAVGCRRGRRRY